jgi:hypothetical protein
MPIEWRKTGSGSPNGRDSSLRSCVMQVRILLGAPIRGPMGRRNGWEYRLAVQDTWLSIRTTGVQIPLLPHVHAAKIKGTAMATMSNADKRRSGHVTGAAIGPGF